MILIDLGLHAIPTHDIFPIVVPILLPSQVFSAGVRSLPNAIVLQAPINVIGALLIGINCIKLPDRWLVVFDPVLSAVIADIDPTIIAVDQVFRVVGINPQGMVIDVYVGCVYTGKFLPSVRGCQHGDPININPVSISRCDMNHPKIIPVTVIHIFEVTRMGFYPGFAAIIGTKDLCAHNWYVK